MSACEDPESGKALMARDRRALEQPLAPEGQEPARTPSGLRAPCADSERSRLRIDLPLRALVRNSEGQNSAARLTRLEDSGLLVFEAQRPLGPSTWATVEFCFEDGPVIPVAGRVVFSDRAIMHLQLERRAQGARLLEHLRSHQTARQLREPVRVVGRTATGEGERFDETTLLALWDTIVEAPEDQHAHQRFMQDCMRAQRLDLAVRCYQELKAMHPEDERAARYLHQVGTILGFYFFPDKGGQSAKSKRSRSAKLGLFVLLVFSALLGLALLLLGAIKST